MSGSSQDDRVEPEPARAGSRRAAKGDSDAAGARVPTSPSDQVATLLDAVRGVVTELSDGRGLGLVTLDVSLERELGLGSLERVELAGRIERAFAVRLPEAAVGVADTPRQLLGLIRAALGEEPGAAAQGQASAARGRALLTQEAAAPEPAEITTLVEVLEYHARCQPQRVHIILRGEDGEDTPITYAALHRDALAVARELRARGLERGRCVAIMLPTGRGYFAAFFGALLAGGVPVPLYPPFRLDRIAEYVAREALILGSCDAQMMITFARAARVADMARDRVASLEQVFSVEDVLARLDAGQTALAARVEIAPTDTALIQYTSGSTGDPKGVELTHANVLSNIRAARAGCALTDDDVVVSWLPLYHDMGLIGGWLMCMYFGTPTVLMSPLTFLTRPERWLGTITEFRATCSVAPNFAFDLCVKRIDEDAIAGFELAQVRAILNGSEPILPATLDRFATRFAPAGLKREALFCAYGLAENMVAVSFPPVSRAPRIDRVAREAFETSGRAVPVSGGTNDADALEFVCVGSAVLGHELRVVDGAGAPAPERQQGTIHFRGPSAFKGYFGRPDATAKVKLAGGWVDTGDLGYIADGELFITGRVKDVIIKGGRNYYPHELEAAAAAVKGVRQGCVAAFSVRDESLGTEKIVVVAETRERDAVAREQLTARVVAAISEAVGVPPDHVVLAGPGAVPKTSSGKIRRTETRRLYRAGELDRARGSFARQAAGLFLEGVPARVAQLAQRVARAAYGGYAIGTLLAFCGVTPIVGRVVPAGRPVRRMTEYEARAALRLVGLSPRVRGLERIPEGPCVLVANHCGYLDFIIVTAALPADTRFVVKGELKESRFLGPFLDRTGHVFLDRHVTARALADLEQVAGLLRAGERVLLFPEGTFSAEIGMRPFKLGAFRLACEADVPVVPVAIRGSRRALRDGTWLPRHVPIELEVLEPIAPSGREIADVVRLRDEAARAIAARIDEPRLHAVDITPPGGRD